MAFTAKDVAALREATGAGMMDCKKALVESNGDMEAATLFLREKGLAAAAKKASRIAADGAVAAYVCDNCGAAAVVEINSETDFAAKSDAFQSFVGDVAKTIVTAKPADVEALLACPFVADEKLTVADALREKVLTIGENIQIRRFAYYDAPANFSYIHMGGKIGVLLNMTVPADKQSAAEVTELGRDIAMQIAAMRPLFLSKDDVDQELLENEKKVFLAQALEEGKPQNVAEKMVAGRVNKYYQEICLLEQPYVKDGKLTVAAHVQNVAKALGTDIQLKKFTRFEKGEGMAKREDDFAAEVAKMQGQ